MTPQVPWSAQPAGSGSDAGGKTRVGFYKVTDFGAVADGQRFGDAAITSGQATLSSAGAAFTNADVGKLVAVVGAGVTANGGVLKATIQSVSGGVATLSANASTTVSNAVLIYGTDNATALQACMDAIPAINGGVFYAPAGIYVTSGNLQTKDRVRMLGDGPGQTLFCPVKDGGQFINNPAQALATPGTDMAFEQFQIDARGMFRTGGYQSDNKPLGIAYVKRVRVTDVFIRDSPATAFPFDFSFEQVSLTRCYALNAGRMNDGTQPGGSGFGMGTQGTTDEEPTTVIDCRSIGAKQNGIFIESQAGTGATMSSGYRLIGNYCSGNRFGIMDAGGRRSIILGNTVTQNSVCGIAVAGGTITSGIPGTEGLIANNISYANTNDGLRLDFTDPDTVAKTTLRNNISSFNGGHGLSIRLDAVALAGCFIDGNYLWQNGQSGIRVFYAGSTNTAGISQTAITDNVVANNGTAATAGDQDGIRIEVPCTDLRLVDNWCFDRQGTKTQAYGLVFTQAITGGTIADNDCRNNLTGGANITSTPSTTTVFARNPGVTHRNPSAVTVTASPFSLGAGSTEMRVAVTGGTVSDVSVNAVTVAAGTNVQWLLQPGDTITVTYSSLPTVVAQRM